MILPPPCDPTVSLARNAGKAALDFVPGATAG
jgi:hypothetical protein